MNKSCSVGCLAPDPLLKGSRKSAQTLAASFLASSGNVGMHPEGHVCSGTLSCSTGMVCIITYMCIYIYISYEPNPGLPNERWIPFKHPPNTCSCLFKCVLSGTQPLWRYEACDRSKTEVRAIPVCYCGKEGRPALELWDASGFASRQLRIWDKCSGNPKLLTLREPLL